MLVVTVLEHFGDGLHIRNLMREKFDDSLIASHVHNRAENTKNIAHVTCECIGSILN